MKRPESIRQLIETVGYSKAAELMDISTHALDMVHDLDSRIPYANHARLNVFDYIRRGNYDTK